MTSRVFVVSALSLLVTLAAVATGWAPLVLALGGAGVALFVALPLRSRRYLLRRGLQILTTVFVAMGLVWVLAYHLPPNPPINFAGDTGFPGGGQSLRDIIAGGVTDGSTKFDLRGALSGYVSWIGDLFSGRMGDTTYSETVEDGVARTIPISMQLVLYGQIIAAAIAVPIALIGVRRPGRGADATFKSVSLVGLSAPVFMMGPILVFLFGVGELGVFGVDLGYQLFPTGRYTPIGDGVGEHLRSMALPSATLGFNTAAVYLVLLRSEMAQQLTLDHAHLAKSKGLSPRRIIRDHALRPASPTVIAAIAAHTAVLLGNLVIIERIFLLPGFGDYVLIAITRNDIPAIVGSIFVTVCILAVVNLLADAALLAVDPRIETAEASM